MRIKFITQTERLILRPFNILDVKVMCGVLCDPEVMLFSDGVKPPTGVRGWIENCVDNYPKSDLGIWAVVVKNTNDLIGYCGLIQFPDIDGQPEIEIGFRLLRVCWGQGYATEAAVSVRDYAFDMLLASRLVSLVDPRNIASIRVVEKLGMRYEKDVMLSNYNHPDHLYSIHRKNVNV
jgi:ribosomal-protein-alanine N-acetyltransferase